MTVIAMTGPATLADIQQSWPPTVAVDQAAGVLGISRSHGYELVRTGNFPVRVIKVGTRVRVVTADLVRLLSATQ